MSFVSARRIATVARSLEARREKSPAARIAVTTLIGPLASRGSSRVTAEYSRASRSCTSLGVSLPRTSALVRRIRSRSTATLISHVCIWGNLRKSGATYSCSIRARSDRHHDSSIEDELIRLYVSPRNRSRWSLFAIGRRPACLSLYKGRTRDHTLATMPSNGLTTLYRTVAEMICVPQRRQSGLRLSPKNSRQQESHGSLTAQLTNVLALFNESEILLVVPNQAQDKLSGHFY